MRARLVSLAVSACLAVAAAPGLAQSVYPTKPIRVLVGIAAGSVTDVVMRAAAPELSSRLGQPLLVENRPGGNMVIGAEGCARSAPDGYTLCVLSVDSLSINPHTFEKLSYDPEKDFKPVTNLFYVQEALVASASVPASSVAELRAFASGRRGKLNFGTLGPESFPDLFLAWLRNRWNADIVAVPYKGGGPIASAILADEVQLANMGAGNFIGGIQAGKIKALAVDSPRRLAALPDVPTMAEAGLGDFPGRAWWGLLVPAGTPDAIVSRLNAEVVRLFREPKFVEFLEGRFIEPAVGSAESFAAFMKADRERAAALVKLARQGSR